jgi:hypothetical protein
MLDQIKNLIKHGKNTVGASDHQPSDETSKAQKFERQQEADADLIRHPDDQHLSDAKHKLADTVPKDQHMSINEEAAKMVEEEKIQRNTMPVYPGLERFKLLEKMGEYVSLTKQLTHYLMTANNQSFL